MIWRCVCWILCAMCGLSSLQLRQHSIFCMCHIWHSLDPGGFRAIRLNKQHMDGSGWILLTQQYEWCVLVFMCVCHVLQLSIVSAWAISSTNFIATVVMCQSNFIAMSLLPHCFKESINVILVTPRLYTLFESLSVLQTKLHW